MDEASIIRLITESFPGVDVMQLGPEEEPAIARGDTFFIYDPGRDLDAPRRLPFATIVTKDYGDFDDRSNLDRAGVFRLNVELRKETFRGLYGKLSAPSAPPVAGHDFTALDTWMPHPVYAPQSWICILNPGDARAAEIRAYVAEAHAIAVERVARRASR